MNVTTSALALLYEWLSTADEYLQIAILLILALLVISVEIWKKKRTQSDKPEDNE